MNKKNQSLVAEIVNLQSQLESQEKKQKQLKQELNVLKKENFSLQQKLSDQIEK
jgi:hypothetical protein